MPSLPSSLLRAGTPSSGVFCGLSSSFRSLSSQLPFFTNSVLVLFLLAHKHPKARATTLTSCLLKFWTHCSNCSSFVSSAFPSFWRTCRGRERREVLPYKAESPEQVCLVTKANVWAPDHQISCHCCPCSLSAGRWDHRGRPAHQGSAFTNRLSHLESGAHHSVSTGARLQDPTWIAKPTGSQ